jgi:hypothetical protein
VVIKCAAAAAVGVVLHVAVEQPVRRARPTLLVPTVLVWLAASAAVTLLAVAIA